METEIQTEPVSSHLDDLFKTLMREGPKLRDEIDDICDEYDRREKFRTRYGYANPTEEAIREIISFANGDSIVEVGAGRGFWAYLICEMGGKIRATDYATVRTNRYAPCKGGETWVEIEFGKAEYIAKHATENVLMTIWPPYIESMASDALKAFKGDKLVYVGESEGGCTADDAFFLELRENWCRVNCVGIPQWDGLHDELMMFERKK